MRKEEKENEREEKQTNEIELPPQQASDPERKPKQKDPWEDII